MDFASLCIEDSGKIIFLVDSGSNDLLLFTFYLPVSTDFRIEIDIHFIFIKKQGFHHPDLTTLLSMQVPFRYKEGQDC